jgi:hypothetical protein
VTRLSGSTASPFKVLPVFGNTPMVRASSRSEKLPSSKPHALEHKIRFIILSKRYTSTVKKVGHTAGSGEERCAGLVSFRASDASINRMRPRFLDAGKRNLVLINSMLSLSSGLPGRAQEPPEKAIPQQAIPAQKKVLTEATSTGRERHKYWLYALYFDVGEPRTIQGVWQY